MSRGPPSTRRALLSTVAVGVAALAGCVGSASSGNSKSSPDGQAFDGWLANTPNYDGIKDWTGRSTVAVAVGGESDLVFAPPAIRINTGTTVRWEWDGGGSAHNVKARDGSFESPTTSEAGETFEHSVDETGGMKYLCVPHEYAGMKGVVKVV